MGAGGLGWLKWLGLAMALLATGLLGLAFWLRADAAALDYGRMALALGESDPAVNGLSLVREFEEAGEFEADPDLGDLLALPAEDWDHGAIGQVVLRHRPIFELFEAALDRPVFRNDQAPTPETLIPEVGLFREYAALVRLKARLAQAEGDYEGALQDLLRLEALIERMSQAGGGLIHFLTAVACQGILHEGLAEWLDVSEVEPEVLIATARAFNFHKQVPSSWDAAVKSEFHFAKYSIDSIFRDPRGAFSTLGSMGASSIPGGGLNGALQRGAIPFLFKPVRTTNRFFLLYEERIGQLEKPYGDRAYPRWEKMERELENRGLSSFISRNPVGRAMEHILIPAMGSVERHADRIRAASAAMQVLLALRAYELEQGRLPDRLGELVPRYLEALPADPYDGGTLRYSKEKAIIYAVGIDLEDSGGSELPFAKDLSQEDQGDSAERDDSEPTFAIPLAAAAP